MITREQLESLAVKSGLNLYQQEKDYLLKLFLFNYYRRYSDAVFKGGTCLKYLYGLERFSEDIDFNIKNPKKIMGQVRNTLKEISALGVESYFIREEIFPGSYACEVGFKGPLYKGTSQTQNKFRIDAGHRTGTLKPPVWKVMKSEYPDTEGAFLVLVMSPAEMLAEKFMALSGRKKGRDLYDIWFMIQRGVEIDKALFRKKGAKVDLGAIPSKQEYVRDMSRLSARVVPYGQVKKDILGIVGKLHKS